MKLLRLLVGAGAAGGIAAVFHAPIAGVFFALEVVLADFSTGTFGVVVLTAVIASATMQAVTPSGPELGISNYLLGSAPELALYMLLGVLLAPVSALFIRALYWQQDLWEGIKLARPLKTMFAGALIGVFAVFLPQIMGTGHDTLNAMLNPNNSEFTINLLLLLGGVKLLATVMSLAGGFVGGMFAPSLFVGAALGRAFGEILATTIPGSVSADPAAFAIAGMAAVMAGVVRAPDHGGHSIVRTNRRLSFDPANPVDHSNLRAPGGKACPRGHLPPGLSTAWHSPATRPGDQSAANGQSGRSDAKDAADGACDFARR